MTVLQTRLRYISSKKVEKIISYVNALPYKIEIKGGPIAKGSVWFLYFIPPDEVTGKNEVSFGNLD